MRQCAGGIAGYVAGSEAHHLVLNAAIEACALKRTCIAPDGSGYNNHRFLIEIFSCDESTFQIRSSSVFSFH